MNAYGVLHPWTFLIGSIIILILPGPNMLNTLQVASSDGWRIGMVTVLGVLVGDIILMTLVAMGAAGLIHECPFLYTLLKSLGAVYLFYLGMKILYSATRQRKKQPDVQTTGVIDTHNSGAKAHVSYDRHHFLRSLVIALLNPKAIFFFLAFFIQFADPHFAHPILPLSILGGIFVIMNVVILGIIVAFGVWIVRQFRGHPKITNISSILMGVAFLGFGYKLISSNL